MKSDSLALSRAQRMVWLGQSVAGSTPLYNMVVTYRISGALDRSRFARACDDLVQSSDILQSRIVNEDTRNPQQQRDTSIVANCELVEVSSEADLENWLQERSSTPVDPTQKMFDCALLSLPTGVHVFYWCQHHISSDGSNIELIIRYIESFYSAEAHATDASGSSLDQVDSPPAYYSFIEEENAAVGGKRHKRMMDYWNEKSSRQLSVPEFYSTPFTGDYQKNRTRWDVDQDTCSKITDISQSAAFKSFSADMSLFVLFTTALLATTYRVAQRESSESALRMGFPSHARNNAERRAMLGMFVSVGFLDIEMAAGETFSSLASKVQRETARSMVNLSPGVQNADMYESFSSTVNLIRAKVDGFAGLPVEIEWRSSGFADPGTQIDLHVTDFADDGNFTLLFDTAQNTFGKNEREWLLQHFRRTLDALLRDPDASLESYSLLEEEQLKALEFVNSRTSKIFPAAATVVHEFIEQASRTPDAAAVQCKDVTLTYSGLDQLSNRIANWLGDNLVTDNSGSVNPVVVVCMRRSINMLGVFMGLLKAGCTYVPVDPSWPEARRKHIYNDTGAALVIYSDNLIGGAEHPAVIAVEDLLSQAPRVDAGDVSVSATDLAYIMYTSGSTGQPKGVMVNHDGLRNYVCWASEEFHQNKPVNYAFYSSVSFDLTMTCLYVPLVSGGTVIAYPDSESNPGLEIQDVVLDDSADVLDCTPAHLALAIASLTRSNRLNETITTIILGGEEVRTDIVREATAVFPNATQIINEYGPTEAVVGCTVHRFDAEKDTGVAVPIGVPAANTRFYIVDQNLQRVPAGVVGELCIARDSLAVGYLNAAELTRELFPDNPYEDGKRFYRSGDLARWDENGNLEFLGRRDAQIKINGIRVELGEIENALLQHQDIEKVVIRAISLSQGHQQLVAYYTAQVRLENSDLRLFLREHLPPSLIPGRFIRLESMPVTAQGKIDIAQLPVVDASVAGAVVEYRAPRNETESTLVDVWQRVLERDRVGIDDNIHDLGGNSMDALQIVAAANDAGLPVTARAILENGSIADLAAMLEADGRSHSEPRGEYAPVGRADRALIEQQADINPRLGGSSNIQQIYDLTNAQTGILFHCLRNRRQPIYAVQLRSDIEGQFNAAVFRDSWNFLVERHDALRTVFLYENLGKPLQVVLNKVELPWTEHDFTNVTENNREQWLDRVARESGSVLFEFDSAPMLRVAVCKLSDSLSHVIFDSHHIILDGLSTQILFEELQTIYSALQAGETPVLPDTGNMHDYLRDQTLLSADATAAFWQKQLGGFETPTSPILGKSGLTEQHATDNTLFSISEEASGAIRDLARRCRVTENTVYQAAWAMLLSRYNCTRDVVFGYTVNGRSASLARDGDVVGMFVNTLPMRINCDHDVPVLSLLQHVQNVQYDQADFETSALADIQRASEVPVTVALFDSLMVFQPFNNVLDNRNSIIDFVNRTSHENSHLPVTLELFPGASTTISVLHNENTLSVEALDDVLRHFKNLLLSMSAAEPDALVGDLVMLEVAEQSAILDLGSGKSTDVWTPQTIHHQFIQQAAANPSSVALREGSVEQTYQELDEQSDCIARFLMSKGIGSGMTVGVCFKRSMRMVPAMLGVLKCGACYVPLDPTYPTDRLAYMLEDSDARLVISDSVSENVLGSTVPKFLIDTDWEIIVQQAATIADSDFAVCPDNSHAMYIMYTSGSTGLPKGVVGTHAATLNRFAWMWRTYPFTEKDVCCQKTALGFVDSVFELFGALLQGITTVVIPDEDVLDIFRFVGILEDEKITRLTIVPSFLSVMVETDDALAAKLQGLRLCVVSGEPLPERLASKFLDLLPDCPLLNLYGSTEVTADVTAELVEKDKLASRMPIGRAIDNVQMLVLDSNLQLAPRGAVGEICVTGTGLSGGYHNQPELNLEKFVVNPFGDGLLFRTGDLGRFITDGRLEHHGRRDSQIKIRGHRIETSEIETCMLESVGVTKAVVGVIGRDQLVGYFVTEESSKTSDDGNSAQLRSYLESRLAPYMVPQQLIAVERIPLLPNGKINRLELSRSANVEQGSDTELELASSLTEVKLAEIWRDVLELPQVGINQDFYDLGGNSISAMQIMVNAGKAGMGLTLDQIMTETTIAKAALVVSETSVVASGLYAVDNDEVMSVIKPFNDTAASFSIDVCTHQLIAEQAAKTPFNTAVSSADTSLSYEELTRKSAQLATYLSGQGAKPGAVVGICLARSTELLVSILAVMQTGAAYCPMDSSLPAARLAHMVEDAGMSLLINSADTYSVTGTESGVPTIDLASVAQEINACEAAAPHSGEPDHVAYVMYTSGSTGSPRGVRISHRNLVNLLQSMCQSPGMPENEVLLAISSISFDISAVELLLPLLTGARVDIATESVISDMTLLAERLDEQGVTVLQSTPELFHSLVKSGWAGKEDLRVFCGGDSMSSTLAKSLLSLVSEVWNFYGPTETTIWSTCERLTDSVSTISIGRPLANTYAYVLNDNLDLCPLNTPGELYIGGAGVAMGLQNQSQLEADSFVADPFKGDDSARLYRTGDVAKWQEDGRLACFGRIDNQFQFSGMRVEPAEIESALEAHPDVERAVVTLFVHDDRKIIAAYAVPVVADSVDDIALDIEQLRASLADSLPSFMIPGSIVQLDEIPLTVNGKVDRRALPVPTIASDDIATEDDTELPANQPSSELEQLLHNVWCRVLGRDKISTNSDFFELGVNSIVAMELMVSAKKAGCKVSLKSIMQESSIAKLALASELLPEKGDADAAQSAEGADFDSSDSADAIRATIETHPFIGSEDNVVDMFPLTAQQRGILFHILLQGVEVPLYIAQLRCDLVGQLDLGAFEKAWHKLVHRHDTLRTVVLHEALMEPLQVIVKQGDLSYTYHDIRHLGDAEREGEVKRIAEESLEKAINIEYAPLLRVVVVQKEDHKSHLMVVFHHLLLDGWSIAILSSELEAFYEEEITGKQAELPEPGSFRDHVLAVNSMKEEEVKAFWQDKLQGMPAITPIATRPENNHGQHATGSETYELDAESTRLLGEFAIKCRVTTNVLVECAFALLLGRYNSTRDIMFGFAVTGRSSGISNYENTVGMFINSLPLRIQFDLQQKVGEWFKAVQLLQTETVEYEHTSLAFIKEVSGIETSGDLFDAMLVFQNFPTNRIVEDSPLQITNRQGHENSHVPFTMQIFPTETLIIRAMFIEEIFEEGAVEDILKQFGTVLRSIASLGSPDALVGDISLMSEEEVLELVGSLNQTEMTYPEELSTSDLIWQQAEKTPDKTAVLFEDDELTYAQLTEKADKLANHLLTLGACPNMLIGICLQRGLDLIISLLAVQRTGAAYLPLDPEYPQGRIDYILDNASSKLLITNSFEESAAGEHGAQLVCLDTDGEQVATATGNVGSVVSNPGDLAYVIYTSGSTGLPKGVQLTRQNVTNFLVSMSETPGIVADDVLLAVTTVAFDIAVLELYLPLINGACVDIAPRELAFDGNAIAERFDRSNITMMQATPTTWRLLLAADWQGDKNFKALVGGEALPRDLCELLVPKVDQLWNMYGPTETTVWSTCALIDDPEDVISVGKPIGNTQIFILDQNDLLCPINMPGELCIGGDGVSLGYLDRDDLTQEKFIENPIKALDDKIIYRTGDYARWLPDGRIECMGRMDSQVKLRGFRIELGEIENVLVQRSEISQAVVNLYKDDDLELLVAYIVTVTDAGGESADEAGDSSINEGELREYMREGLPFYMIPGAFVVLDEIPLTPNGKIDRKALPAPNGAGGSSIGVSEYDDPDLAQNKPQDAVQQALHTIWCETMKREQLSVNTHFFDIGGNSIVAMQIMAAAKKEGIDISLIQIFELGTIAELSQAADTSSFTGEFVGEEAANDPDSGDNEEPELGSEPTAADAERIAEMLKNQKKA